MTKQQNPYNIIKHKHVTEKAQVLENLTTAESNPSLRRFEGKKYVFIVDRKANKQEIAKAFEEIYRDKNVKVISVNTINLKGKPKRVRGILGKKNSSKKAIITLEKGDSIDNT